MKSRVWRDADDGPHAKTATAFRQPYVGALNCDSSVSRGDVLTISGTAYGTDSLMYYIFGPGNLTSSLIEVNAADTFSKDIETDGFALGSYYLIVQHPMYDRYFNIGPIYENDGTAYFMMNWQGSFESGSDYLFNTAFRSAANAAQALCDSLDSQNIDDLYVKSEFIVSPGSNDSNVLTLEADVTSVDDTLQYHVSGFCTAASSVSFYVQYPDGTISALSSASCSNVGEYSEVLSVSNAVAGNYTLYAVAGNPSPTLSSITGYQHAVYQYELSLTGSISSTSVLQGNDVYITGNTSAGSQVQYHVFGKKTYQHGFADVTNGAYNITLDTDSLYSGEYYVVVHSTGRDSSFNVMSIAIVGGNPSFDIYLYPQSDDADRVLLFNTAERYGSSAAKALCQGLSSESIDDAHLDFSFTVIGKSVSLDSVDDIQQGCNLTVSGTSRNVESESVTVSVLQAGNTLLTTSAVLNDNGSWECTLDTSVLDIGEYKIAVSADSFVSASTVFNIREQLLFISIDTEDVVVQGNPIPISGTANGALLVRYYLFGTNFFMTGSAPVIDGIYNSSIAPTTEPAPGQYFLVIQHPSYDGIFNIGPKYDEDNDRCSIVMNPSGSYTAPSASHLFNVYDRQSANAAQALCNALDSQLIDDLHVKASIFIVHEDESWSVSGIPKEVVKGDTIVISGTAVAGKTVTVEMLSTAFAAVPKETIGSAALIVETTKAAKDGTWEVKLDTSDLNIDEYSVSVLIDGKSVVSGTVCLYDAGDSPGPIPPDPPIDEPVEEPDDKPEPETLKVLNLSAGWNFVSVQKPLDASNNTAAKVFGHVDTAGNAVLGYNAAVQNWEQITADTVIKPLSGYWIYANESTAVPLQYSELPVSPAVKTLYEGWNAVGLSAGSKTTANSAFAGLDWRTVLPWNLEKGNWGTPLVNGGSSVNSAEQYLTLGNGCWLYVEADGTLIGLIA